MSVRRDYKPDSTWKDRRQIRRHGLLVVALILIGLLASLVAYIRGNKPEAPVASLPQAAQEETQGTQEAQGSESTSIPLPPKPKYDFYSVLPGRQVVIPEDEITPRVPKNINTPSLQRSDDLAPEARSTGSYIVQAGSFRNYADADRLKAELALLGIEARIEGGTGADHSSWHRVRIGPFKDSKQTQALRQRLQDNDIPSIAIKTR